jgi:hypothetical protein
MNKNHIPTPGGRAAIGAIISESGKSQHHQIPLSGGYHGSLTGELSSKSNFSKAALHSHQLPPAGAHSGNSSALSSSSNLVDFESGS